MSFLPRFTQRFNQSPHTFPKTPGILSIQSMISLSSGSVQVSLQGKKGMWEIQAGSHAGLSPVQNWGPAILNLSPH